MTQKKVLSILERLAHARPRYKLLVDILKRDRARLRALAEFTKDAHIKDEAGLLVILN